MKKEPRKWAVNRSEKTPAGSGHHIFGTGDSIFAHSLGMWEKIFLKQNYNRLDPVGSTVRYEMMKLCTGSVKEIMRR